MEYNNAIDLIEYDSINNVLHIKSKNDDYVKSFLDVPKRTYLRFVETKSSTQYFQKEIEERYRFVKTLYKDFILCRKQKNT